MQKTISPWVFIPTSYFLEGLPYAVVNILSAVIYTKLGVPNDVFIFWTSLLYLPWVLKMLWAPREQIKRGTTLSSRIKSIIRASA